MNDQTATVLTKSDGPVRWLIFNRPDKLNAISLEMSVEAHKIIEDFADSESDRVLIVVGSGGKAFVSGADISEFEEKRNNAKAFESYGSVFNKMFTALRDVEKPTIAMINGYCFGGGVALACSCDLRIAADDAKFSIPAARLGVGYSADFVEILMNLVGPSWAKEILFTGNRYSPTEARDMGLIGRVVPTVDLEKTVVELAQTIAANAPLTVKAAKIAVRELLKDNSNRDSAAVKKAVAACADSEDFKNARRAFMEKRTPTFKGR